MSVKPPVPSRLYSSSEIRSNHSTPERSGFVLTAIWAKALSALPPCQCFTPGGQGTAVDWARANGVINGKEGNRFDPAGPLTRAQTAAILYRYLNQSQTAAPAEGGDGPKVYMTTDISPEGLMAVYKAICVAGHDAVCRGPGGGVGVLTSGWNIREGGGGHRRTAAVKLSIGEPPASNYLRPELIKDVVQAVDGTIVECNTAYGGQRSSTAMHYQVAKDHGFNDIADVVILDENGSMSLPVSGGSASQANFLRVFQGVKSLPGLNSVHQRRAVTVLLTSSERRYCSAGVTMFIRHTPRRVFSVGMDSRWRYDSSH